jgi:crotonobetainyl-CoA:carnitine CoA-transferase CaiB-like acyl-CoA transferase
MATTSSELTKRCWAALDGRADALDFLTCEGAGALPSAFAITDVASAAIATAALSIAELLRSVHGVLPAVRVDRRLASIWFKASLRPIGWTPAPLWDPIAGDYRTRDGWIRLHTNAPHHRGAAESVLKRRGGRDEIAGAVADWTANELEAAIVAAGGCAAAMRSAAEWNRLPQGAAVAREPLIEVLAGQPAGIPPWPVSSRRPLEGLRVLDLTRVLAGPVASRFLAGYGAEVLRIDPPDWDEPGVAPEVMLGKRGARLDLTAPADRVVFEQLLSQSDVLLHGYRPGALERLGYDPAARRRLAPGLIDVCLDAYGWSGPWAGRRGFDSLVQMSTGIAEVGMRWAQSEAPVPLPVQALDHATGYLMAAASIRGIARRLESGRGSTARLSLARTAKLVVDHRVSAEEPPLVAETTDADLAVVVEDTSWGAARRLLPPVVIDGVAMEWALPARRLGWAAARWSREE